MNVGLPGIGIGAIFYLILILAMPIRELWMRLRRFSSAGGWTFIGRQWAMSAAMIALIWMESHWLIAWIRAETEHPSGGALAGWHHAHGPHADHLLPTALGSLLVLAALMGLVHGAAALEARRSLIRERR